MDACSYFEDIEDDEVLVARPSFTPAFFLSIENTDVSMVVNIDADSYIIEAYTASLALIAASNRREAMRDFFSYDLTDMPVMVGAAFFVSSSAGMGWTLATGADSPVSLGIVAAVLGLALGRVVSAKSRKAR